MSDLFSQPPIPNVAGDVNSYPNLLTAMVNRFKNITTYLSAQQSVDPASNPIALGNGTALIQSYQTLIPSRDDAWNLGSATKRWANLWCANGTIHTSDPTLKTDIAPLPDVLGLIDAIDPITFKWKDGGRGQPGKRTHWGFAAPDIKAAFDSIGMDFGGYVRDERGIEHLRPDQLIPVLWRAVQTLAAKVHTLEQNADAQHDRYVRGLPGSPAVEPDPHGADGSALQDRRAADRGDPDTVAEG